MGGTGEGRGVRKIVDKDAHNQPTSYELVLFAYHFVYFFFFLIMQCPSSHLSVLSHRFTEHLFKSLLALFNHKFLVLSI